MESNWAKFFIQLILVDQNRWCEREKRKPLTLTEKPKLQFKNRLDRFGPAQLTIGLGGIVILVGDNFIFYFRK